MFVDDSDTVYHSALRFISGEHYRTHRCIPWAPIYMLNSNQAQIGSVSSAELWGRGAGALGRFGDFGKVRFGKVLWISGRCLNPAPYKASACMLHPI